jgi:hypothetical protein
MGCWSRSGSRARVILGMLSISSSVCFRRAFETSPRACSSFPCLSGLSDPENPNPHKRFTIVLIPADHPSVKVVRPMQVFGYDDAPEGHCEVLYDNVRLNEKECLVGGWGRGFEVSLGDWRKASEC